MTTNATTKDYRDGLWHGAATVRAYGVMRLHGRVREAMRRRDFDDGYDAVTDAFLAGMIDAALEQAQRATVVA